MDNLFLGGFSEASTNLKLAFKDCFQIFEPVMDFRSSETPTSSWLVNDELDKLWASTVAGKYGEDSRPMTVQQLKSKLTRNSNLWCKMAATKTTKMRHFRKSCSSFLDIFEVKEYLALDSIHCYENPHLRFKVDQLPQRALSALEAQARNGRISVADYHIFQSHMHSRHSMLAG